MVVKNRKKTQITRQEKQGIGKEKTTDNKGTNKG